jgi:hypothetical protein
MSKETINNSTLVLLAFTIAFFPRVLDTLGFPPAINFIHFLVIPLVLWIAISSTHTKNRRQIAISLEVMGGLLILLGVILASALLNKAGVINVFLEYMFLAEPFMLLLAMICIPISSARLEKFKSWIFIFAIINLVLAVAQYVLLIKGILAIPRMSLPDNVQGVFYLTGAGNYISVSVSLYVALYYFINYKKTSLWSRGFWLLASFYQLLISDSKQVLLVFMAAAMLLVLTKVQDIGKLLTYLIILILGLVSFYLAIENLSNLPGLGAFKHWIGRTWLYGPNGLGTQTKISGIRIVASYFESPLNWLFGLGPGHTIGRLGGWVLKEYSQMLIPLGSTIHPVTMQVHDVMAASWLAQESTLFSPFFSWAGIWGDLGFLGLGAYLYLNYIVWVRIGRDDFSRFMILTNFVYGLIFTQMEEPGQVLTVAILIGLQWHQQQISRTIDHVPLATNANSRLNMNQGASIYLNNRLERQPPNHES